MYKNVPKRILFLAPLLARIALFTRPEKQLAYTLAQPRVCECCQNMLPASDDGDILTSTMSRVFHLPSTAAGFPDEMRSYAHPFDTSCSNQRVRTYPTRTCQQVCTTPQSGCCPRPCSRHHRAVLPASATPRSAERGYPHPTAPISTTSTRIAVHIGR